MMAGPVAMLETLDLEGLRAEWRRCHGEPPPLRSQDFLRRLLAWRHQTALHGGLDRRTISLLRGNGAGRGVLPCGTTLVREWRGIRHEVEVAEAGFIYAGRRWKSLSEIARTITGSRWNGPRFFGLRPE